jgi:hypothetical protein
MTVIRRWTAALLMIASTVVAAGCSAASGASGAVARSSPGSPSVAVGVPVELRFGDQVATATLSDTPEARRLAVMLPATVELKDVWAQAKSGRLPRPLTIEGSKPVHDPVAGGIYFWPQSGVIAIYYADLGQAVPDPGLICLGGVDTGLDDLAGAGRTVTVRLELASAA